MEVHHKFSVRFLMQQFLEGMLGIISDKKVIPPLWSSGQISWLHNQRFGFDSRSYQNFWEVVGLEWGPLSIVSTNEELLGRKSSGSGLED
jgi:hypothetical protein